MLAEHSKMFRKYLRMPDKIEPASSWTLPPTGRQLSAISRLAQQLGIKEPIEDRIATRWEARQLLWKLEQERRANVKSKEPYKG